MTDLAEKLKIGLKDGETYPISVPYCGNCTMPIEVRIFDNIFHCYIYSIFQYCEYYQDYENCKKWLEKNLPSEFAKVTLGDGSTQAEGGAPDDDDKKRQKRGGKGMLKSIKKKDDVEKRITVSRAPRGKKKSVTVVTGMNTFGQV